MYSLYDIDSLFSGSIAVVIFAVIAIVTGIAAAIVALIIWLPAWKKDKNKGFMLKAYDFFNFNTYWLSYIIKACFIISFVFTAIMFLVTLFVSPAISIALVILLVVQRLLYEGIFVMYSIREQTVLTNKYLAAIAKATPGCVLPEISTPMPKKKSSAASQQPYAPYPQPQYQPQYQPQQPTQPAQPASAPANVCPVCGGALLPGQRFCEKCGNKMY